MKKKHLSSIPYKHTAIQKTKKSEKAICTKKMSTVPSLVLYEHASGYALFRVKEFEEVSALEAEVEASVNDVSAFNSVVR